ncbi:hypothetical protein B0H10DRAFT_2232446 [Mycena sp. CBHHK59/15]|nr:hypothetical protein B0H10DRAFT_2232446 [Mycena sp. CBHHK59/15]
MASLTPPPRQPLEVVEWMWISAADAQQHAPPESSSADDAGTSIRFRPPVLGRLRLPLFLLNPPPLNVPSIARFPAGPVPDGVHRSPGPGDGLWLRAEPAALVRGVGTRDAGRESSARPSRWGHMPVRIGVRRTAHGAAPHSEGLQSTSDTARTAETGGTHLRAAAPPSLSGADPTRPQGPARCVPSPVRRPSLRSSDETHRACLASAADSRGHMAVWALAARVSSPDECTSAALGRGREGLKSDQRPERESAALEGPARCVSSKRCGHRLRAGDGTPASARKAVALERAAHGLDARRAGRTPTATGESLAGISRPVHFARARAVSDIDPSPPECQYEIRTSRSVRGGYGRAQLRVEATGCRVTGVQRAVWALAGPVDSAAKVVRAGASRQHMNVPPLRRARRHGKTLNTSRRRAGRRRSRETSSAWAEMTASRETSALR